MTVLTLPTLGFANVLRSEWTKLRSVRSTYWTALAAVAGTLGLGIAICSRFVWLLHRGKDGGGFDPTELSLSGILLAQVAFGALGVLFISSEYGTGMIRATLGAVPQRRSLLAAKAVVVGGAALVVGELLSFASYGVGQAILAGADAGSSLGDPGVLRAVSGGGLFLTAVALLGFGLGALIRHTAGALSALFGLLFATSAVVNLLPESWSRTVRPYLPVDAGMQVFTMRRQGDALGPYAGLGVLCLYVVATLGLAAVLIERRDA